MSAPPVLVYSDRNRRTWALGALRGEANRAGSHRWYWRVWHVVGPVSYANGSVPGVGRASTECLAALVRAAAAGW